MGCKLRLRSPVSSSIFRVLWLCVLVSSQLGSKRVPHHEADPSDVVGRGPCRNKQIIRAKGNFNQISLSLVRANARFAGAFQPNNLNHSRRIIVQAQRSRVLSTLMSFALALSTICSAQTQGLQNPNAPVAQSRSPRGRVMAPGSSISHAGDKGVRAHTHLQLFIPKDALPLVAPPFPGLGF